jgi:hypothetical protein
MKLHDILLKKAELQELGHFYIVETAASIEVSHEKLLTFVHDFIREYYQKIEGHKLSLTHLMDHPDVIVIGNTNEDEDDREEKFFKVEEAESLNRFFEFKPVQGKRKFAVITEGHRINTTVANKWLKLLEEPQGNSTIFLLNPRGGQLLPTMHSRAIHLRLPTKPETLDFSEWNEMLGNIKEMTLSQFLEKYNKKNQDLSFWVNELIRWEAEQNDKPAPKADLGTWLRSFQEMETFNQPPATKWSLFYSFVRGHVLERLN